MPTKRRFLAATLAATAFAVAPALAQGGDAAVATVRALYDAYQAALKQGGNVKARADAVGEPMKTAFDMPEMLRVAVGSRWKEIPAAKQKELEDAFSRFFIATYATRLSSAQGGKLEVQPNAEARAGGTKIVRTKATDAQGSEAPVDFVVNANNRITDVLLQGTISQVAIFRGNFAAPLKSGADGLLAYLNTNAEQMLAK